MKPTTSGLIFFSILIILLVGAFLFGQWIKEKNTPLIEKRTYNNFIFTKQADTWTTTWQNNNKAYLIQLRNYPEEVELVPMTGDINLSLFNKKNISITFDPEKLENYKYVALTAGELGLNLNRAMGRTTEFTCTTNQTSVDLCKTLAPVTCASEDRAVIMLEPTGPAEITLKNNCIILSGADNELLRATDKLLYIWYGIMRR